MRFFCLPAVLAWEGRGLPPLVGVTSGEAGRARQPIRPVDGVRSRGCGTSYTADADERARQDRRHPEQPANGVTRGSGRRPWPCDRTAGTTGFGTDTHAVRAATVFRSPVPQPYRAAALPHVGVSHSARPWSARGTRGPSTGGGVFGAWVDHLQAAGVKASDRCSRRAHSSTASALPGRLVSVPVCAVCSVRATQEGSARLNQ